MVYTWINRLNDGIKDWQMDGWIKKRQSIGRTNGCKHEQINRLMDLWCMNEWID